MPNLFARSFEVSRSLLPGIAAGASWLLVVLAATLPNSIGVCADSAALPNVVLMMADDE